MHGALPIMRPLAGSGFGHGLAQALPAVALFPLPALDEQVDALKPLEHVALGRDLARPFETSVLAHREPPWTCCRGAEPHLETKCPLIIANFPSSAQPLPSRRVCWARCKIRP